MTDSRTADSPQGAWPREGAGVGSQEQAQQASEQEAASQEEGRQGTLNLSRGRGPYRKQLEARQPTAKEAEKLLRVRRTVR